MEIKEITNTVCGKKNCSIQATTKIIFPLGFSAGFCNKCADDIVHLGIGTRSDLKNDLALAEVESQLANAKGTNHHSRWQTQNDYR